MLWMRLTSNPGPRIRIWSQVPSCWYQTGSAGVFGFRPRRPEQLQARLAEKVSIDHEARHRNPNVYRLIEAYRRSGHLYARVNPVPFGAAVITDKARPELSLERYGLSKSDNVDTSGLLQGSSQSMNLDQLEQKLEQTYCGTISAEFDTVSDEVEREWLWQRFEQIQHEDLDRTSKKTLAIELLRSQNFDNFVAAKFSSVKRYGGEGAESMMAIFLELIRTAGDYGINEYVIGMPHRGRLNLMTGLFKYPAVIMFRKMKGLPDFPPNQQGASDVLSHLTSSVDLPTSNNGQVHVTMLPNPSHLEAVNPVACGKVRGRQMSQRSGEYHQSDENNSGVVCIQVHGDAAITGQGINQETLQMSQLPHFKIGGSLHVVVNNQVGFTTPGDRGRSSRYCTDLAKMIEAPVVHVNGDCPESVVKATKLVLEYQQLFQKDIFLDMICYRRHGHNELDDPTFTNPLLYKVIHSTKTIPDIYAEKCMADGILSDQEAKTAVQDHTQWCNQHYDMMEKYEPSRSNLQGKWSTMAEPGAELTTWNTGIATDLLKYVGAQCVSIPDDFRLHSHLNKHLVDTRLKKITDGDKIDWGLAEALALGSLLYQGFNVRISGQDVGRATFAHRHAMVVDQDSNEVFIPLNNLRKANGDKVDQGFLEMANSNLSEEAVLGFEYGMSVESPKNLLIWEAQFGDFFNGAQIILDTYVGSGESKWGLQSALVMLLPHGMDGAGPEHSSCRMERWLQMSDSSETSVDGDNVNWHIVNPTTAAQYFHLLRRQMIRNFRKPLVVVGPKVLLRLPAAMSNLSEMSDGTHFKPVIGDDRDLEAKKVKKIIFTSGKHYYALKSHVEEKGIQDVALVRVEQLCPFPTHELQQQMDKYSNAKVFVWSQEEHRNMGGWSFVEPRFRNLVGASLRYAGRDQLCQPAVGVGQVHQKEAKHVIEAPFKTP